MSERPRPRTITDPVTITVDGKEVDVQRGELLIDACERNGTYIPRFCYHPRMEPVGMCRMCLVEVDTGRGPALQPSCMIECSADMKVATATDGVQKAQDGVLEFLLINHPLDCPVCDKGGECPLQDQTMAYGPGESRWTEEKRHYPKPIPISETVYLDRERCILCDRCTRFASDVAGDPLIHFMDRGANTQVNTFPDEPFASYFSGNTVQICPVGALTAKPYRFKARPWDLDQLESTCTGCSVGCRISVQSSRNQVLRYLGVDSDPVNWGWLCDKGRFGFEAVNSDERIVEPLIRTGDELVPTRWTEALTAAADALRGAVDGPGDPDGVALIGGARLTNESAYHWVKLIKGVIGSDHVDAQLGDGLPAELVLGLPGATIDEVCRPGSVVLYLGPDPKEELPVLFLRLRHAMVNDGVRLVELSPVATSLTPLAAASVRYVPGDPSSVLDELFAAGAPGPSDSDTDADSADTSPRALAARLLAEAGDDLRVVVGRTTVTESATAVVDAVATILAAVPGARFLPALRRGNVRGALEMGMAPGLLPGRVRRDSAQTGVDSWPRVPVADGNDTEGILRAAAAGRVDTLILLGADPLADFPDRNLAERALLGARTVIAIDQFLSESARRAAIVLPAAGFAEVDGTTTNLEGRVSTVQQKVTAKGTSRPDWLIAAELAARLGHDFAAEDADSIWGEINSVAPATSGVTLAELARSDAADGLLLPLDPDGVRFDAPARSDRPAIDSYSLRLVATRTLYDGGTLLANSPSSAGLARGTALRLNPVDFDRVGVVDGGQVRITGNDRSFLVEVQRDESVPQGVAAIGLNQAGAAVTTLIDANAPVTDVRLEAAP